MVVSIWNSQVDLSGRCRFGIGLLALSFLLVPCLALSFSLSGTGHSTMLPFEIVTTEVFFQASLGTSNEAECSANIANIHPISSLIFLAESLEFIMLSRSFPFVLPVAGGGAGVGVGSLLLSSLRTRQTTAGRTAGGYSLFGGMMVCELSSRLFVYFYPIEWWILTHSVTHWSLWSFFLRCLSVSLCRLRMSSLSLSIFRMSSPSFDR